MDYKHDQVRHAVPFLSLCSFAFGGLEVGLCFASRVSVGGLGIWVDDSLTLHFSMRRQGVSLLFSGLLACWRRYCISLHLGTLASARAIDAHA